MLGAIIGDIVGSRFEFNNTRKRDFRMFTKECEFTDDTVCTVAVADAIAKGINYRDSLLNWCNNTLTPKAVTAHHSPIGSHQITHNPTTASAMARQ